MNTLLRRPTRLLFPVFLLGAPLSTGLLVGVAGVAPAAAMTAVVLALIVVVVALERRWPYRAEWGERGAPETATDVAYIALASVPDRLTRLGVEGLALLALGAAGGAGWGAGWGAVPGAIAAFLLADLGKYLIHRASHEHPWLWRFHLAHHQPARIDALNALRLHPVNIAYNAALDALPMVLLRVPVGVAAVAATLRAAVGVLQHANLDLDGGGQWLVNAPSYHRTHHAEDVGEANHNYASTLLLWDRLFGTLLRREAPARVGVGEVGHRLPGSYTGQLLYPFCEERLDTTCVFARFRALVR